jgi:hypothetical protein
MSEILVELAKSLSKAQGEMTNAPKDANNPHFKADYATLASIWDVIRKPLSNNGLSVIQLFTNEGEILFLETVLMHASGQLMTSKYPILPIQNTPQGYGSAITYARRYTLAAMLGIAPEDDDGVEASKPVQQQEFPKSAPLPHVVTESQLKRLFAITSSKKWPPEVVKERLKSSYGHESTSQLTPKQYDEFCKYFEATEYGKPRSVTEGTL